MGDPIEEKGGDDSLPLKLIALTKKASSTLETNFVSQHVSFRKGLVKVAVELTKSPSIVEL